MNNELLCSNELSFELSKNYEKFKYFYVYFKHLWRRINTFNFLEIWAHSEIDSYRWLYENIWRLRRILWENNYEILGLSKTLKG